MKRRKVVLNDSAIYSFTSDMKKTVLQKWSSVPRRICLLLHKSSQVTRQKHVEVTGPEPSACPSNSHVTLIRQFLSFARSPFHCPDMAMLHNFMHSPTFSLTFSNPVFELKFQHLRNYL